MVVPAFASIVYLFEISAPGRVSHNHRRGVNSGTFDVDSL
jgi:hypothetical protein